MSAHELYKTGDPDAPPFIKDENGEIVLDLCKRCGRGEIDLRHRCNGKMEDVSWYILPLVFAGFTMSAAFITWVSG